ncbi:hypothetical protein J2S92_000938 [Arthrobacter bambusae]|nr:hypothetical protein [Arthrobacter bambusae]MDQ0234715.1 hypothetical protein [Arthrobacter bambusae]
MDAAAPKDGSFDPVGLSRVPRPTVGVWRNRDFWP